METKPEVGTQEGSPTDGSSGAPASVEPVAAVPKQDANEPESIGQSPSEGTTAQAEVTNETSKPSTEGTENVSKPSTEEVTVPPKAISVETGNETVQENTLPPEGSSTDTDKPSTLLPAPETSTEGTDVSIVPVENSTGRFLEDSNADRSDADGVSVPSEANADKSPKEGLSLPLEKLAAMGLMATNTQEGAKPAIENLLKEATGHTTELKLENHELQKRVVLYAKRRSSVNVQLFQEGQDTEYQACLTEWAETKAKLERMRADYDNRIDDMRQQLKEKQLEADESQKDFLAFKWKVAREAEHSVYGRILSRAMLDKMYADEQELDLERERVRIQGRQLKSQLKRLEQALKRKDQLTGGLHLVDYEQLKMENEVMTEKLASKNEEIAKLKKKTTYVVHVVTHLREKLQQVQKDVEVESEALEKVEKNLLKGREDLQEINARCTVLKLKKARLQKNVVNITNPMLLDDLDLQKEEAEALEKKIAELQNHYNLLQVQIHEHNAVLRSYTDASDTEEPKAKPVQIGRKQRRVDKDNLRWGVYRRKPITKHYQAA